MLGGHQVELIGLYGWLKKLPPEVVAAYEGRSINQHPGPLDPPRPDFGGEGMYGMRVHIAVQCFMRNAGRNIFFTEATAQRVAVEFDKGEVIERETLMFPSDWSPVQIQEALLPCEHRTQIRALQAFAGGRAQVTRRCRPLIKDEEVPAWQEAIAYAKSIRF